MFTFWFTFTRLYWQKGKTFIYTTKMVCFSIIKLVRIFCNVVSWIYKYHYRLKCVLCGYLTFSKYDCEQHVQEYHVPGLVRISKQYTISFLKRRTSYHFNAYQFINLRAFDLFNYRRNCFWNFEFRNLKITKVPLLIKPIKQLRLLNSSNY